MMVRVGEMKPPLYVMSITVTSASEVSSIQSCESANKDTFVINRQHIMNIMLAGKLRKTYASEIILTS